MGEDKNAFSNYQFIKGNISSELYLKLKRFEESFHYEDVTTSLLHLRPLLEEICILIDPHNTSGDTLSRRITKVFGWNGDLSSELHCDLMHGLRKVGNLVLHPIEREVEILKKDRPPRHFSRDVFKKTLYTEGGFTCGNVIMRSQINEELKKMGYIK